MCTHTYRYYLRAIEHGASVKVSRNLESVRKNLDDARRNLESVLKDNPELAPLTGSTVVICGTSAQKYNGLLGSVGKYHPSTKRYATHHKMKHTQIRTRKHTRTHTNVRARTNIHQVCSNIARWR